MQTRLISLLMIFGMFCQAQDSEFALHDNGLIYSNEAVAKLRHIVDSLNLKFKVCDANKKYYALKQGKVNFISLEKHKVKEARKDIEGNISWEAFKAKYPKAVSEENLVAVKHEYTSYDNKPVIQLRTLDFGRRDGHSMSFEEPAEMARVKQPLKGKWLYNYSKKTNYSAESIDAFYFVDEPDSKPLPTKYAKWIQYSDCLVDTTAQVFTKNARETGVRYYDTMPNKARKFTMYVESVLKRPSFSYQDFDVLTGMDTMAYPGGKAPQLSKKQLAEREALQKEVETRYEAFSKIMRLWQSQRLSKLDSLKNADPDFMPMLREAYDEVRVSGASENDFEELVGLYISKDAALELKRSRRVVGGCSMDQSPRIHAFNIALLSAETTKWEIFLRSHLDIMNDRFDRVSDGSYAQGGRATYIKELETLEINVPDLILGISLRFENASDNHYFSSIGRTGRALSESRDAGKMEELMLGMIADNELDDFNRMLMYYLFDNYNYNLQDADLKAKNIERLKLAVSKMPEYISSRITFKQL